MAAILRPTEGFKVRHTNPVVQRFGHLQTTGEVRARVAPPPNNVIKDVPGENALQPFFFFFFFSSASLVCNFTWSEGSNPTAAAAQVLFSTLSCVCVCVLIALLKAVPAGLLGCLSALNYSMLVKQLQVEKGPPLGYTTSNEATAATSTATLFFLFFLLLLDAPSCTGRDEAESLLDDIHNGRPEARARAKPKRPAS